MPLDTNEHAYYSALGMSEVDRAMVFQLVPASFDELLQCIAGCKIATDEQFPSGHWSSHLDCCGPRYPYGLQGTLEVWRKQVSRFFTKAFRFGESDEIFLVNVRYIYRTTWGVFLRSWEAFSPFHDYLIVISRDDPQFAIMAEDIYYVGRGNRPPLIGFDSPKRAAAWTSDVV